MKIINGEDLRGMKIQINDDGTLKILEDRIIPKEKFIPKKGENFFVIGINGKIQHYVMYGDEELNFLIKNHLVFKYSEFAEDYKWFLEQLNKYSYDFCNVELHDDEISKYFLEYKSNQKIVKHCVCFTLIRNKPAFKSEKDLEMFMKVVGEERIKKYIFDVWD